MRVNKTLFILLLFTICFSFLFFIKNSLVQALNPEELSSEGGWVEVKDLNAGDLLKTKEGWIEIESIEYFKEPVTVYNLSVSDPNTYYANGILAHNKGSEWIWGRVFMPGAITRIYNGTPLVTHKAGTADPVAYAWATGDHGPFADGSSDRMFDAYLDTSVYITELTPPGGFTCNWEYWTSKDGVVEHYTGSGCATNALRHRNWGTRIYFYLIPTTDCTNLTVNPNPIIWGKPFTVNATLSSSTGVNNVRFYMAPTSNCGVDYCSWPGCFRWLGQDTSSSGGWNVTYNTFGAAPYSQAYIIADPWNSDGAPICSANPNAGCGFQECSDCKPVVNIVTMTPVPTNTPTPTPYVRVYARTPGGSSANVRAMAFTWDCGVWNTCFREISENDSGHYADAYGGVKGGAGIVLYSNQKLMGVTPAPAGGTLAVKNNNYCVYGYCPYYNTSNWQTYWWNTYPNTGYRNVTYVVATLTPTQTPTPTPYYECGDQSVSNASDFNCACDTQDPNDENVYLNSKEYELSKSCNTNDGRDNGLYYNNGASFVLIENQTLVRGNSYTWRLYCPRNSSNGNISARVWVDWDGNGASTPASVGSWSSIASSCNSRDFTVAVPGTTGSDGYARVRIRSDNIGAYSITGYNSNTRADRGEIEDYHFNLVTPTNTPTPTPEPASLTIDFWDSTDNLICPATTDEPSASFEARVDLTCSGGSSFSDTNRTINSSPFNYTYDVDFDSFSTANCSFSTTYLGTGGWERGQPCFVPTLAPGQSDASFDLDPGDTLTYNQGTDQPGPWWQSELGDVWANAGDIFSDVPTGDYLSLEVAGPGALVSNGVLISATGNVDAGDGSIGQDKNWLAQNTGSFQNGSYLPNYDYWYAKLVDEIDVPSAGTSININSAAVANPNEVTVYHQDGNIIDLSGSLAADKRVVVLATGDIMVDNQITVAQGGFLLVVAGVNIDIEYCPTSNDHMDGVYIATNDLSINTNCAYQLEIQGTVAGLNNVNLNRDFTDAERGKNNNTAILKFSHRPDFIYYAPKEIKVKNLNWQEANPKIETSLLK